MEINPISWANLGPWGVIAVMVALIALGFLVPRRTVRDLVETPKEVAQQWKEAHDLLMLKLDVLVEQNKALIELAKTQEQLLRGLPRVGGNDGPVAPRQIGST